MPDSTYPQPPEGSTEPAKPKTDAERDEDLLAESRKELATCIEAEASLRLLMRDDVRFAALDQWPADIRAARENDIANGARPCLTIDQSNQFITQVVNEMMANRPSIKTRPVDDIGDPATAKIFQGLIRHIEDQSSAKIAYQTSGDSAATAGLGFVRVVSDFIDPESMDQEILIKCIPDTFSVYLSRHIMPDGSDADKGWIFEQVPIETFKRKYPKAKFEDTAFPDDLMQFWKPEGTVTVCEYYYKEFETFELVFLADGETMPKEDYDKLEGEKPEITGRRNSERVKVKWCKHTGVEILERTDVPGTYIPIAEEVGKEKIVDGKRVLWGLVRPAKDSLRAFNYWSSMLIELMALGPKAPWLGAVGQFATNGDKFDKANVTNFAKLEYDAVDVNGIALPPPRRNEPIQLQQQVMQVLAIMQNNVKSSLGMYKAAIGEAESQQSGKAILALQRESNTGTMHFGENQAITITHVGRIIVGQIPKVYDKKRILRILGEDGKPQNIQIDPAQKEPMREIRGQDGAIKSIYNLNVGKYDVTVTVGPGYATSRQEAATVMTELANTAKDPVSAAIMQYGAVKNADFAGSEEITRMLKAVLPPQVLQGEKEEAIPPAAMQKIAQLTQGLQQLQLQGQELAQENQQLKAGVQADMAKIEADKVAVQLKLQAAHDEKMTALALQEKEDIEHARIEDEKATAEINRKWWVAEQEIAIKRKVAQDDEQIAKREMEHKANCERIDSITELIKEMHAASQASAAKHAPA